MTADDMPLNPTA